MSFNKIIAIGNLGRDPELRYTPQGDVTTWFKVTLWRKLAENASKYLTKGRSVYVEGRLQVEEWTDRDGKNRHTLIIQCSDMHFISDTRGDEMSSDSTSSNNFSNQNNSDTAGTTRTVENSNSPADDDIPF
jgi:single-strand DNA-binding protein